MRAFVQTSLPRMATTTRKGCDARTLWVASNFPASIRARVVVPHHLTGGRCNFSDKLLGYSPMAASAGTPVDRTAKMPTAKDVKNTGGVWAPTSAKRDKLGELRLALEDGQKTLDDAATPEQKLDLYLADGLNLIAKSADQPAVGDNSLLLDEFEAWMIDRVKDLPTDLHQVQWERYLSDVARKASALASACPPERYLCDVRDFLEWTEVHDNEQNVNIDLHRVVEDSFEACVMRHRLGLVQAAANHFSDSWSILTTVSDADVDRAAVQGNSLEAKASTLALSKINDVLRSFVRGSCSDRVNSIWTLMDRDDDGLLNQAEMDYVCSLAVTPVQNSLQTLFQEALNATSVRDPVKLDPTGKEQTIKQPSKKGWIKRRREQRVQKRLLRQFQDAMKRHFQDEVEMPHRLRCIYAWADKEHQNNKIDSIVVDSEWGGRKRYVELEPKISLEEFRLVQQEHFTHLDRVGQELIGSFREDILVDQGKGRQNRELRRDCMVFLSVVCVIDFVIISL